MEILKLRHQPELLEQAAQWFSTKWAVSVEEYRKSIQESLTQDTGAPQWYVILDKDNKIIAGAGVVENDFHDRKDLSPNFCALFVEEEYRKQGLAKDILIAVRKDFGAMDFEKIYLLTDHKNFYEKYDWEFLTMVVAGEDYPIQMYVTTTL